MDDMFFTQDERSLRRGKRVAKRTETCRPCVVTIQGEGWNTEGVVLDANPLGMLVRSLEPIPTGAAIAIQLMRDEGFQVPFSAPIPGEVVRQEAAGGGFYDHGVRLQRERRSVEKRRPLQFSLRTPARELGRPRVDTLDVTIGATRGLRRMR